MDDAKLLQDGDYIQIFNKTLGMVLRSPPKLPNFYGSTIKSVTYHDDLHRYEKVLSVPVIEETNGELKLLLVVHGVDCINLGNLFSTLSISGLETEHSHPKSQPRSQSQFAKSHYRVILRQLT